MSIHDILSSSDEDEEEDLTADQDHEEVRKR